MGSVFSKSEGDESQISSRKAKYYWTFTLFFLMFGGLVAAITLIVNYNIQYTNVEKEIQIRFVFEKQLKHEFLNNFLKHVENVVGAIAVSELTTEFSRSGGQIDRFNLNELLLAETASNASFMQLRFIDASGMEAARVDRLKGLDRPVVIAEEDLQNKKDRYYFKEASRLPPGQFWHSNFDLNIEHGKIEIPIRPTHRIATSVFSENKLAGLIIANISIDELLSTLGASSNFDIFIIDQEGEFILHPDPQKSWSRYLPSRTNLIEQFPKIGRSILVMRDTHEKDHFSFPLDERLRNHDRAIVVLIPRQELLQGLEQSNLASAMLIALTVLLVSFFLSWLVALIPARLQNRLSDAFFQIKKYTDVVNRHVMTSSTDREGNILKISSALEARIGYRADEILGQSFSIVRHPDTPGELYEEMWQTLLHGKTWRGEIQNRSKDGDCYWLKSVITPDFDRTGEIVGFTSISEDVSDKKQIEMLSITDGLTGLANRRRLDQLVEEAIGRFDRYGRPFAVVMLDVDHFKQVNDRFGHKVGDGVLVEIATLVRSNARQTDSVSRWGGEEFVIVCSETPIDAAMTLAEKLRMIIEEHAFAGAKSVTASFGVTAYQSGDTADGVFLRVDEALYRAKGEGRNCVTMLTKE